MRDAPLLLLDEPTSHLDLKHQVRIYDLLKQMQAEQGIERVWIIDTDAHKGDGTAAAAAGDDVWTSLELR